MFATVGSLKFCGLEGNSPKTLRQSQVSAANAMSGGVKQFSRSWTTRQMSLGPPTQLPPMRNGIPDANNRKLNPDASPTESPHPIVTELPVTDAAAQTFQKLDGVYEHTFELSFPRPDVFRELTQPFSPLGVDTSRIQVALQLSWIDSAPASQLAVGCIRETRYFDEGDRSFTISELVALEQDRRIVWDQLESTTKQIRMVGLGTNCPSLVMSLEDTASGGTKLTLTYTFHRVLTPARYCGWNSHEQMPTHIAELMSASIESAWAEDMTARKSAMELAFIRPPRHWLIDAEPIPRPSASFRWTLLDRTPCGGAVCPIGLKGARCARQAGSRLGWGGRTVVVRAARATTSRARGRATARPVPPGATSTQTKPPAP